MKKPEVRQPLNKYPLVPLYFWEQLGKYRPLFPQAYNQLQKVNAGLVLGSSRIGFVIVYLFFAEIVCGLTDIGDIAQIVYKSVIKLKKICQARMLKGLRWPRVENKCSHQWTRQPSPFRRDSCMNIMLCLKCCVLWSDKQSVLIHDTSCKKLIYSLILQGEGCSFEV